MQELTKYEYPNWLFWKVLPLPHVQYLILMSSQSESIVTKAMLRKIAQYLRATRVMVFQVPFQQFVAKPIRTPNVLDEIRVVRVFIKETWFVLFITKNILLLIVCKFT